jgi:SAM-dependent methyltransferase
MGEASLVHGLVGPGASVLDLGCGTGRIADPLVRLGHEVVGVDQSVEMLACVRLARRVAASITDLRLRRTFDCVLMASHLVNVPEASERAGLLAAASRHLRPGGRLVAEWHPPEWFEVAASTPAGRVGDVDVELTDVRLIGDLLTARVVYTIDGEQWGQDFTAERLSEDRLAEELATAGLSFDSWAGDKRTWFSATKPTAQAARS